MLEIERKFLVKPEWWYEPHNEVREIQQGYLNTDPERTVRIRLDDLYGYMTVKGKGSESGMSRFEWEMVIHHSEARSLLGLCTDVIEKTRYSILYGDHTWEVDVFHGLNDGLVLAEIELRSENEAFIIPDWIGEEVTGDARYYNACLAKHPYSTWRKK